MERSDRGGENAEALGAALRRRRREDYRREFTCSSIRSRRNSSRSIARMRHWQQAALENDTSRHR